ncbi:MAG: flagellar biosynthesis protein FlgH [Rhodobacteraceae bacterium]|nr:flagellar biosynthesis protein FlgH [Paracoccaceae bacterium]
MIKFIIIGAAAALFGAAGYFGGMFLAPEPAPPPAPDKMAMEAKPEPKALLFKMPLGKVTVQIIKPKRIMHMVADIDLFVMGVAEFEAINGAMGRARLRDAVVTSVAELAETEIWMLKEDSSEKTRRMLSEYLVRRIYEDFPSIRTARVNSLDYTPSARQ